MHPHIVIDPTGTVIAVTPPFPRTLLERPLAACGELAQAVRDAGAPLIHELRASANRAAIVTVPGEPGGPPVHLIAIEGLVIRRASTDLRALLASKLAVVAWQAEAGGVSFSTTVDDAVPATVLVDSERLAWMLTTLVGNALRYVTSGTTKLGAKSIAIAVKLDTPPSTITIEIRDTGPGIPAATVSRLFANDGLNVRGSGLALLMVSDIMAAHGGRVAVESSTDAATHGTTIRLTFPGAMPAI